MDAVIIINLWTVCSNWKNQFSTEVGQRTADIVALQGKSLNTTDYKNWTAVLSHDLVLRKQLARFRQIVSADAESVQTLGKLCETAEDRILREGKHIKVSLREFSDFQSQLPVLIDTDPRRSSCLSANNSLPFISNTVCWGTEPK